MEPFKITFLDTMGKTMVNTHFHNSYEIYFLIDGTRDCFIQNHTYVLQPKDIVFFRPKAIHRTIVRDSPYIKRYVMMIPQDFVRSLALEYEGNLFKCFLNPYPVLKLQGQDYTHILNLFSRIHEEYEKHQRQPSFIISVLVTELLFYLNQLQEGTLSPHPHQEKTLSRQTIDMLMPNYHKTITLDWLSKELFVSTYQLCRIFKEETGFTVMEYLTFLRLKEAMQLLDTTDQSITDIGFTVGFNNINHFIRTFKKHMSTTPKQYQLKRKSHS